MSGFGTKTASVADIRNVHRKERPSAGNPARSSTRDRNLASLHAPGEPGEEMGKLLA